MNLFQMEQAKHFIRNHDHFLVVSHVQPDGDAASSTMAVGLILRSLHKTFVMVNSDPIPQKFRYLSGYDDIVRISDDPEFEVDSYQYVIAVDCADYSRIAASRRWFASAPSILNIDHHPTNDGYGDVRLIRPDAAATAEILFDLAQELETEWTKELATCIYTGLLTDTGGFRYSNTTPEVMRIASQMLAYGVEGHQIAEHLLEKIAYSHIVLLKKALSTLSFDCDNRICWMLITERDIVETEASHEDLEGLVNYPRNIEGVDVGILFKEVDRQSVKVSLRSNGSVDVASFAKSLGGGGHVRAAGCTVNLPLADAVSHIVQLLKRQLS